MRSSGQFDRFVRLVHRRLVVLRIVESAGGGALLAAAAMLILVPVRLHQGESAVMLVGAALPLGAVMGLVWALFHRPGRMAAIIEADRQLGLEDLLSTAWVVKDDGMMGCWNDGMKEAGRLITQNSALKSQHSFAHAILALAEARAAAFSPNAVILNRFGQRAWGVIGLSCALAMILAMISANPLTSRAVADNRPSNTRPSLAHSSAQTQAGLLRPNSCNGGTPSRPDFPGARDEALDPAQHAEQAASKAGARDPNQTLANPDGTGGGSGRSKSTPNAADLTAQGSNAQDRQGGRDAAGGGGAAASATGRDGSSGMSAGASAKGVPAAPWNSAAWPAARRQAESAVDSGAIPAGYHDIIREYFR